MAQAGYELMLQAVCSFEFYSQHYSAYAESNLNIDSLDARDLVSKGMCQQLLDILYLSY